MWGACSNGRLQISNRGEARAGFLGQSVPNVPEGQVEQVGVSFAIPTEEVRPVNTNHKLTLAVLVGVSSGLAAAQAIHARQAKAPPAYIIAEVEKDSAKIQDPAALRRYADEAPKSLAPFNGRYLARAGGGMIQTLEGEAPKGYIVVIGFESVEKARGWYYSPAYEAIKPIRQNSTKSRILIVEGDTAQ
jgi:uncharacterized protein (DUF1330 family)